MTDTSPPPPADPGIGLALGAAFLGVYAHGGFYAAGLRGPALEEAVLSPALKRFYPEFLMPIRGAPLGIGILTGSSISRESIP